MYIIVVIFTRVAACECMLYNKCVQRGRRPCDVLVDMYDLYEYVIIV